MCQVMCANTGDTAVHKIHRVLALTRLLAQWGELTIIKNETNTYKLSIVICALKETY